MAAPMAGGAGHMAGASGQPVQQQQNAGMQQMMSSGQHSHSNQNQVPPHQHQSSSAGPSLQQNQVQYGQQQMQPTTSAAAHGSMMGHGQTSQQMQQAPGGAAGGHHMQMPSTHQHQHQQQTQQTQQHQQQYQQQGSSGHPQQLPPNQPMSSQHQMGAPQVHQGQMSQQTNVPLGAQQPQHKQTGMQGQYSQGHHAATSHPYPQQVGGHPHPQHPLSTTLGSGAMSQSVDQPAPPPAAQMAGLPPPNEYDQRLVLEFTQLLDKSRQLFNGIRDLPLHGTKQWQGYFGRTFDVYTRLWKFQQQHRQVLDRYYGLKRWQIGEIASKIGQLYYHYYLRTSETTYLLETFSFYSAIRSRAYYSHVALSENPDLMVKKLRYYARFIVVCLLLKKLKLVRDLVRELSRLVDEYIRRYDPEDQLEWSMILTEIKSFVEADNVVSIVDVDNSTVVLSHRLTPYNTPPLEKGVPYKCVLQEVILVGNTQDQVKCTELSLDMFWMLQALEREPHEELACAAAASAAAMGGSGQPADTSPAPGRTPYDDVFVRSRGKDNPHKYLLYRPSFAQLMLFLTSGYRDLGHDGAMLLYVSADGCFAPGQHRHSSHGYDVGGVLTALKPADCLDALAPGPSGGPPGMNTMNPMLGVGGFPPPVGVRTGGVGGRDADCLHPGDVYTFTRKPFFLVVDSDNSSVFLGMPNLFDQPVVTLASPVDVPSALSGQPKRGSIFTLFLHSPLAAFCYICNISEIAIALWDKCQAHVDKFMCDAGRLLVRCQKTDRSYIEFYSDDFLRLLILRFIFCTVVLRLHRSFRTNAAFQPHCHPPVPVGEVLQHPSLQRLVLDLACILDVLAAFRDADETIC